MSCRSALSQVAEVSDPPAQGSPTENGQEQLTWIPHINYTIKAVIRHIGLRRIGDVPVSQNASDVSARVALLIARGKAAARAANTRTTYKTGWSSWARWAAEHGLPDLPVTVEGLEHWLATLWDEEKKPNTLRVYLAAVANELENHPGPNPARHFEVRELMSGLTREAADDGITPRQAAPLRWRDIGLIAEVAHMPRCNQPGGRPETPEQARQRADIDIAMICVAHDAALRCSELLALTSADIDLTADGGWVWIRRSKTDQNGQGTAAPICEFTARALARIKPADARPDDRVFEFSPSTVTRRIRAAAQAAGIDTTNITSHSPRVGMAHDLVEFGIDLPGLILAGRWKSYAMPARYTQRLSAHHTTLGQYLKTQDQATLGDDA